MIKLIDKLPKINKESVAVAKIECTFCAYGNYPKIALFWQQENENGEIVALFSLLDGNLTVFAKEVNEELRLFLKALSPDTVFAEAETAESLGIKGEKVNVVRFFGSGNFEPQQNADLKRIFALFKKEFKLNGDEFIADLSHRLRHAAAFCVLKEKGAAVVQTAGENALITGICVENEGRKVGLGSEILGDIKNSFSGTVYACCKDSVLPFYLKNSFEKTDTAIIGRI